MVDEVLRNRDCDAYAREALAERRRILLLFEMDFRKDYLEVEHDGGLVKLALLVLALKAEVSAVNGLDNRLNFCLEVKGLLF